MFSTISSTVALAFAISIPAVSAHGFVSGVVAGGRWYQGEAPVYSGSNPPRPAWYAQNQDTGYVGVADYGTEDITCHKSATPGNQYIEVNAGESIDLQWTEWPESHHGPVLTYLARCHPDCTRASPESLKFFAIHTEGLLEGGNPGTWASDALIANNNTATVTIPQGLSGNFVLRHDIIALHAAMDQEGENGAQNYPNCVNLKINGAGGTYPCKSGADCRGGTELFDVSDPGITINIYYPPLKGYEIPGPQVWSGLGL